MRWVNFFHIYQPPNWPNQVVRRVARESYRPLVHFLLKHRHIKITLNISGSLTEQLQARSDYRDIIHGLRTLATRKQVELTGSAMYHSILPLLPEREVIRQIKLNQAVNRKAFGPAYRPTGFFPPEMAYSPSLGRILSRLGFSWVIMDGISHPHIVDYQTRYRVAGTKLSALFRNRFVSDYLAFEVQHTDTERFLETVERWNSQRDVLVTAMDGENLGHHRHAAKRIWQKLVHQPHIQTVTVSELLTSLRIKQTIRPRPASWSSRTSELNHSVPFSLWRNPANPLHRLQWQLFSLAHALLSRQERRGRVSRLIRTEFDRAASSDWYWWASREPWWDVDIIVAAAQRLLVLVESLTTNSREQQRARGLVQRIVTLTHRWHGTGAAQRHASSFLKSERTPRYLGGKSVKYKS